MREMTIEEFIRGIRELYKSTVGEYPTAETYGMDNAVQRWLKDLYRLGVDVSEEEKIISGMDIIQFNDMALFHYADFSVIYGDWKPEDYWNAFGGIYRTCRSTVIDLHNGETVIKPFDKFFNINELPETSIENVEKLIENAKEIEISNKLDGSIFCVSKGTVFENNIAYSNVWCCTSRSLNPKTSTHLQLGMDMYLADKRIPMMVETIEPGTTLMFEMIAKEDSHVVYYPDEMRGLYLIGVREPSGRLLRYSEVIALAKKYGVKTTEVFNRTFSDVFSSLDDKKSDEAEGFVIRIDDKYFKLKYNDYVSVHKTINLLVSASGVIESFRSGNIDDLISKVPVTYKEKISEITREIKLCISNLNTSCECASQICRGIPEFKDRMIYIQKYIPKPIRGYCIEAVKGNPVSIFSKRCKISLKYIRELNDVCEKYISGPKWIDRLETTRKEPGDRNVEETFTSMKSTFDSEAFSV